MATYTLIKLKDMSPLHMGTGKENYDFSASRLQSDTISASLAAMRVKQGNADGLEDFISSFAISSAFPYVGDHYFLPCPIGRLCVAKEFEANHRKSLKKIKYAELSLWDEIIHGKVLQVTPEQLQGEFLLAPETIKEFSMPYRSQVSQRVTVMRDGLGDAEPFFFDWTYFRADAGLFCLTNAKGSLLTEVLSLFSVLGEEGLGTDKSVGGGKFSVEARSISIEEPSDANGKLLLSLYIPTREELEEIDLEESRFELIVRGGYMAGSQETDFWHLRKKSISMMNVGAVLRTSSPLVGKVVDLSPSDYNDERMHPVYRSGMPFYLSIKS